MLTEWSGAEARDCTGQWKHTHRKRAAATSHELRAEAKADAEARSVDSECESDESAGLLGLFGLFGRRVEDGADGVVEHLLHALLRECAALDVLDGADLLREREPLRV